MKSHLKDDYLTLLNSDIPFKEYIEDTKQYIRQNRVTNVDNFTAVVDANSPYELIPERPLISHNHQYKYGALLIHGLLDSPFSLKDIGLQLQAHGILSRSILLPGHGTKPEGLLDVTYQQWLKAVEFGLSSLSQAVEKIFVIGYSTGAALSIVHALQNKFDIAGLIMLSPAIKLHTLVNVVVTLHKLMNTATFRTTPWFYQEEEKDYVKYRSVTFNGIKQVAQLTDVIADLSKKKSLEIPILMVVSQEDETVSGSKAIEYFKKLPHPKSELLLYAKEGDRQDEKRVTRRPTNYPALNIKQFSHVCIPFSPTNHHYGQNGDFIYASHLDNNIYGAYNRIEAHVSDVFYDLGVLQHKRHELTYNPDFDFMSKKICDFILNLEV